jgi:5,10-methylenetetrahydromethanopterin reductase
MMSGTVLEPGENPRSNRVLNAVGPWGVSPWHIAYTYGGAAAVDALPGGAAWRAALEGLTPPEERHLLTFEGHVTHLSERDLPLLEHLDLEGRTSAALMMRVGDPATIRRWLDRLAEAGYEEVIYTPSGPDPARELTAFAGVRN